MDWAFSGGCGVNFDPKKSNCITAYEINRIMSNSKLRRSTLWFDKVNGEYQMLGEKELQRRFGKYFSVEE